MLKVVSMEKARRQEMIDAARDILKAAEAGDLEGMLFILQMRREQRGGTAGSYRRHPEKALQAVFLLERHLCEIEYASLP